MTELDERLTALLRSRAEQDEMNIEALLTSARRRGRALRRRRYLVGGAAAAVLLVTGLLSAGGVLPAPPAGIPAEVPAVADALPRPPLASGRVAAADLLADLGNGHLYHLDINGLIVQPPDEVGWSSGQGEERLWIRRTPWVDNGLDVTFESTVDLMLTLTRSPYDSWLSGLDGAVTSSARVRGKPATVVVAVHPREPARASVAWQPSPGVYAQLVVVGRMTEALRAASLVRVDQAYRCATPARLGPPPTGPASRLLPLLANTQRSCGLSFSAPHVGEQPQPASSSVGFTFDTWYLVVGVSVGALTDPPTTTINGRPARIETFDDERQLQASVEIEFPGHMAYLKAGPHPEPEGRAQFDRADIVALAEGYTDIPSQDPESWPASPVD